MGERLDLGGGRLATARLCGVGIRCRLKMGKPGKADLMNVVSNAGTVRFVLGQAAVVVPESSGVKSMGGPKAVAFPIRT
jgi:hypothetical protein